MQVKLKDIAKVSGKFRFGFGGVNKEKKYKERNVVYLLIIHYVVRIYLILFVSREGFFSRTEDRRKRNQRE
jgi:hypothetical protein